MNKWINVKVNGSMNKQIYIIHTNLEGKEIYSNKKLNHYQSKLFIIQHCFLQCLTKSR